MNDDHPRTGPEDFWAQVLGGLISEYRGAAQQWKTGQVSDHE
jgi:hypothetical protein